jgi:glutamate synthase domain-containing protein 1
MSYEQKLENDDAYQKSMNFKDQVKIVKLLQQKYIKEKNLSSKDAQILAWKKVLEGSHIFEDYEEEKTPEVKVISQKKIGLTSDDKKKSLKLYDISKKLYEINKDFENYSLSKIYSAPDFKNLKIYFTNLNKKIH